MKTANTSIQIFSTLEKAQKAFDKCLSADLLYSAPYKAWYLDMSKTALKAWPKSYTLLSTK